MNLVELQRALRQLRCSGMAAGLESRLLQAQAEKLAPIDFLSTLVGDELLRRQDRLLERRLKQAGFRDMGKTLDAFDFDFNRKLNRRLVFELATGRSSPSTRTACSSARQALARVISPRPSAWPSSSKAIACSIARRTRSPTSSPMHSSPALARPRPPISRPSRCPSSTTSTCASSP